MVSQFLEMVDTEKVYENCQLFKIDIETETEYVLGTFGTVDTGVVIGKMAAGCA